MAIPEAQLQTWSHQGAKITAAAAYQSVRNALAAPDSPIRGMNRDIYLQGSYGNDTNVRGDSDVDVVVQLNSTFGYDLSQLTQDQIQAFAAAFPTFATYNWPEFRRDVLQALRLHYGRVEEGNRSLKINSNGLGVDIIAAIEHRKYNWFHSVGYENCASGMRFYARDNGRTIINFPRLHHENGVQKNSEQRTNGWYKASVRLIKNARSCAVERGYLGTNAAPSYFVECLVFNVPDGSFGGSFQKTFVGIVTFLRDNPMCNFVCQNCQMPLFGDTAEQWSQVSAASLTTSLIRLWNEW